MASRVKLEYEREPWKEFAACADLQLSKEEIDAIFFPERGPGSRTGQRWDRAREICGDCPVSNECLEYAIRTKTKYGFFGGKTPRERGEERDI